MARLEARPPAIPDYNLIRPIGRGSYGDVWLAEGLRGSFRAIKVVWKDRFPDPRPYDREFEGITRFAAVSIREPSQLALLHAGRNEDFFYYVMELADDVVRGRDIDPEHYAPLSLEEVRLRRGRLPVQEVVSIGVALARALATLHANSLVHRDIKPSNVIFVGGVPKLADVGLVALASAGLTFVGTEGFVPPEGPGAFSADVYSTGKVLYELATGQEHYFYPRLPSNLDTLPDRAELVELNEVILRACETNVQRRFDSAEALLDELLLLQAGKSVRRLRRAEHRTTVALRFAAGLAVVAAIAGAGAAVERHRANEEMHRREQAEAARDELARENVYAAGIARAQHALETDDVGPARRILAALAPAPGQRDLRGFEWDALWNQAAGDPAEVLRAGGPAIDRIVWSEAGRTFAVRSVDNHLAIWDASTHRQIRTIPGLIRCAGYSADGRWIVGMEAMRSIRRWSVATGEASPPIEAKGLTSVLLTVGNDAALCYTTIADGNGEAQLTLWSFARQRELWRRPLGHDTDGQPWGYFGGAAIALNDRGTRCVISMIKGLKATAAWKLEVLDVTTGDTLLSAPLSHPPSALGLSRDGSRYGFALRDTAEVALRDVATRRELWRSSYGNGQINLIVFSPDDQRLAVAGNSGAVRILDAATGKLVGQARGQEGAVTTLLWPTNLKAPVIATEAGELRFLQPVRPLLPPAFEGSERNVQEQQVIAVSPHGTLLASNASARSLQILRLESGEPLGEIKGRMLPVAFTDDDASVYAVTLDGLLQRWQISPAIRLLESDRVAAPDTTVGCAQIATRGQIIAIGDNAGKLHLWDRFKRREIAAIRAHSGDIWWALPTPGGDRVVSFGKDLHVRVWDARQGTPLAEWPEPLGTLAAAITPDGSQIAIPFENGDIEIYSLHSYTRLRTVSTGASGIRSLLYSARGDRLLVGTERSELHALATDDWTETALFVVRPGNTFLGEAAVLDLASDPQFSVVAAATTFGRVQLWKAKPAPKG